MSGDYLRNILVLLLMGASGLACTVEADYHRTRYRCDIDSGCPSDHACLQGFCEPLTAGTLPREAQCGTTNLLREDFEVSELDGDVWRNPPVEYYATATEADGNLVMDLSIDVSNAHARYESRRRYLFRSSSVAVELVQFDPATTTLAELEIEAEGSTQAAIRARGDTLQCIYRLRDREHVVAEVPYSEVDHRWLRLREEGGVLFWETSGDGGNWDVQSSTSSAPFSTMVRVELEARMYQLEEAPVQIRFDNLNTTSGIQEQWCTTASFADDFNDGLLGPLWSTWQDGGCELFERDGRIVFAFDPVTPGSCGYETRSRYGLTESLISVEVPPAAGAGITTTLSIWAETDEYMELKQEEDQIRCFAHIGEDYVQACAISYDPAAHRWWRLRHQGSLLYWETSPDGKVWDEAAKHERGEMPIDVVSIGLWSRSQALDEGEIESVENGFDNFNLAGD